MEHLLSIRRSGVRCIYLYTVTHFILTITLGGRCYYHTHFIAEETVRHREGKDLAQSHIVDQW